MRGCAGLMKNVPCGPMYLNTWRYLGRPWCLAVGGVLPGVGLEGLNLVPLLVLSASYLWMKCDLSASGSCHQPWCWLKDCSSLEPQASPSLSSFAQGIRPQPQKSNPGVKGTDKASITGTERSQKLAEAT